MLPPMNSMPIYNSRIIDTYLKLVRSRYPHVSISDILVYAGMEPYEVADQGHWFTQEQIDRFYERVVHLTGNKGIAREAGRYAASPDTLGAMRQYTLGLLGPLKAFTLIQKSTRNFVKSSDYASRKIHNNKVELVVRCRPGVQEKPFQCENRVGFFEAIVSAFNLGVPKIEHPECMFQGADACRYIVSWKRTLTTAVRRVRDVTLLLSLLTTGSFLFFDPQLALRIVFPCALFLALATSLAAEFIRGQEMARGMANLWDTAEQLTQQIDTNYRNTQLARDVGEAIASKTSTDEVIDSVIHVLQKTLDFDRGLVLLANEETQRLEIRGAFGYNDKHLGILMTTSFRLNNPESRGPFVVSFHQQKPILVNNINEIEKSLTPKSLEFVKALGSQAFICCPIVLDGTAIGILAVDNLQTKKPLLNSDMNLLLGITPAIAVSIQNAQLLEARGAQFNSTLRILADSIDARDFLTAGHSEKVADYAAAIAEELDMPTDYVQMIRTAALLHDYGKIGIPDAILKKDGPLTEEERAVIRTHPTKTKQILDQVAFEGIYREIPEIVVAHHERWDGAGYPNALRGEEIPLGARIIAVADFYEAITSKRHYRDPMLLDEALHNLNQESGQHFQPMVVEAFLRYLEKTQICLLEGAPDRRRFRGQQPRFGYRTEVSTEVERRTIAGSAVDISEGGMFVSTPEVNVRPEAEITVTFALPEKDRLVRLKGHVAWVNTGTPRPSERLPAGFGIKFNELTMEIKKALHDFSDSRIKDLDGDLLIERPQTGAVH